MHLYWVALGVLCTWRITHLLSHEDGPFDLLARLRGVAGTRAWGKMLDCFDCLSLLVSVPFAIVVGASRWESALCWPALSGAAILLERLSARAAIHAPPPVLYTEDEENHDELLRKDSPTDADAHGSGDPS
jgi:hypothetical protein